MTHPTTRLVVAVAAQLAAAGNYRAATSLLDAVAENGTSLAAHLLRAKIQAQQGNYAEAIVHWQHVLDETPAHAEARVGLEQATRLQARKAGALFLRKKLYYAVILLFFVGLLSLFVFLSGRVTQGQERGEGAAASGTQQEQFLLLQEVNEKLESLVVRTETPPDLTIDLPGIMQKVEGRNVALVFEEGLFAEGLQFRPEATQLLTLLGGRLKGYVGDISVRVIGHTDDIPMPEGRGYLDNESLGLGRAVAVINRLRASAELPASMFQVATVGGTHAPYPNDTQDNRLRNRTASIYIASRANRP